MKPRTALALLVGAAAWWLWPQATPPASPEQATGASGRAPAVAAPSARARPSLRPQDAPPAPRPPVPPSEGAAPAVDAPAAAPGAGADDTDLPGSSAWPADPEGFRSSVGERLADLQACYETWLHTHPETAGNLLVRFTVPPGSGVSSVTDVTLLDSSLSHTPLEGCLATIFEELRFESPDDAVVVTWPLRFATDEAP